MALIEKVKVSEIVKGAATAVVPVATGWGVSRYGVAALAARFPEQKWLQPNTTTFMGKLHHIGLALLLYSPVGALLYKFMPKSWWKISALYLGGVVIEVVQNNIDEWARSLANAIRGKNPPLSGTLPTAAQNAGGRADVMRQYQEVQNAVARARAEMGLPPIIDANVGGYSDAVGGYGDAVNTPAMLDVGGYSDAVGGYDPFDAMMLDNTGVAPSDDGLQYVSSRPLQPVDMGGIG